jgi:hypothetical protein
MDVGRYYRKAALLPVALTVAGFVAALATPKSSPNPLLAGIHDVGVYLTFIHIYALLPYGIFMAIAWHFFRPEGTAAHRRLAVLAPLYIAVSVGLVAALVTLVQVGWLGVPIISGFIAAWALAVGYLHAGIVIAVAEASAARARWRQRRNDRIALTTFVP